MYSRILLAYDGSTEGRSALREGALVARRHHAKVFLLSVITEGAGTKLSEGVGGAGVSQQLPQYEAVLREGLERLQALGFDASARLVVGEPAEQIGAYAREVGADLVVVGHRRQSALGRWWSGPRGAYLVDHIGCSLLVCRNLLSDEAFERAMSRSDAAAVIAQAPGVRTPPPTAPALVPSAPPTAQSGTQPGTRSAIPEPQGMAASPRRRNLRLALFLLLPLVLLVAAILYVTGGRDVSIDDAYVNAETVGLSTDVSGIVARVAVHDNEAVQAGQVLFVLDDAPFRYALQHAQAQLGNVRDDLLALQANYRSMQAQIRQAQINVQYNSTLNKRQRALLNVHYVSRTAFDTTQRGLQSSQQGLAALNSQLQGMAATLNGDPEGPVRNNPRYMAALAQVREAARELAHTVVRAPFQGIVTDVPALTLGRYLPASTTGFYLVDTAHAWVDAQPKETQLTNVRAGQPVTVRVDTYPDLRWQGIVQSVSPASSQQFSLLPAENTSGNWVKVVQRIPLRVRFVRSTAQLPPLRAGMSVEITVHTGHARGWPWQHAR
ncbi:MAG TPA: universal stress protein [Steroidobacteraceae bacterium]|nr:universal stress protein [Steroidobacteraceae bacterium]